MPAYVRRPEVEIQLALQLAGGWLRQIRETSLLSVKVESPIRPNRLGAFKTITITNQTLLICG